MEHIQFSVIISLTITSLHHVNESYSLFPNEITRKNNG